MKKLFLSILAVTPLITSTSSAQTVRQWSGASSGAWFTTGNWNAAGAYPGVTTATVAGGGADTDIMSVVATNTATNFGINMNSATGGAGGLGLTLAALDWNKTSTTATTIGNSSTTVGGVLKLRGSTLNGVDNTLIRVSGSSNLTLANANSGTATAAQTLGLEFANLTGVIQVDAPRILTLNVNGITETLPGSSLGLIGGGQLIINAPSAMTGDFGIANGRAQAGNATAFGSGFVTVVPGAQAYLTASVGNNFSIGGTGWPEASGLLGALRYQNTVTTGAITINGAARIGAFNGATGGMNGTLAGTDPLEINGADTNLNGTISLNGNASAFNGPITVTQGRFNINTTSGPGGPVTVADGAALGGEGNIGGSLTLGATAGSTLHVNGSTAQVLTAAGNVTANGVNTVLLSATGTSPIRVLKTNATLSATPANFDLPGGIATYRPGTAFSTTTTPGEVTLTLSTAELTWTGATTTEWNSTDSNWTGGGGQFFALDRVTFNDSSAFTTISIPANVSPGSMVVDNSSTLYSFTGFGAISGGTSLIKRGTSTLILSNPNTYTGGTIIEDGMLEVGATDAVPAGITVSNGTLRVVPIGGLAAAKTINLGDASSTAGSRQVVDIPSANNADQIVLSTPLVLTPGAAGKAVLNFSGVYPPPSGPGGSPQFNGTVTLNGRDLYLENTSASGVNLRLWNMYGRITGAGNVHVDVPSPADRVRIGFNGNDFVGDVYLDRGMLQNGTGSGASINAIPNSSNMILAAGTRFGVGATDTMGALIGGAADPGAGLAAALISTNVSSTSPTLTIGSGDRSGTYDGNMANQTTSILLILTKTGTGTQVLNGDCTFTGATTVAAGKLVINAAYASAITVSGGATLGGIGTSGAAITATATANGGANVAPGNSTGTLSAASANLSTGGNLLIEINDGATPKSDKLAVTGVLNVTNADLIVTGTGTEPAYVIASYGTRTGAFATTSIPTGYEVIYNYNDGISSNNIALVAITDPYPAWAASKGLTAANNAKDADPDGDLLVNGLEFYLDGEPLGGDAALIKASIAGTNLRITLKRRDDAETLNVAPESRISLNTGTWNPVVNGIGGVVINVTENGTNPDDIEILIPIGADTSRFVRLRMTLP